MNTRKQKGFTLIELLVVIAIIAILSIVVILTLNPAEILKQARDSNRISDLSTLKSGISFFLADVSTSSGALGTSGRCYISNNQSTQTCAGWFATQGSTSTSNSKSVNGSGWIPVNFTAISSGAPFGNLPGDPNASVNYFYSYIANGTSGFKLAAKMESSKYNASGSSDAASTDGGSDNTTYETGSVLGL